MTMEVGKLYSRDNLVVKCHFVSNTGHAFIEIIKSNFYTKIGEYASLRPQHQKFYSEYKEPEEYEIKVAILKNLDTGRIYISDHPYYFFKGKVIYNNLVLDVINLKWIENGEVSASRA